MKKLLCGLDKNRGFYFVTLFVGIIFSVLSVPGPTVSGTMISAFLEDAGRGMNYLFLYLLIGLFQIAFCLLDSYMGKLFALKQKRHMRENAFRSFSKKDSATREKISSFTSFINNDIPAVVEQYFAGIIDIIKCVLILLLSAVSMLSVHFILALIVFAASALIVLCPGAIRKKGGEARNAYSEALGSYNTVLQSFLEGLRIVKCYGYYSRANSIQENSNGLVAGKERGLVNSQMAVQSMSSFLQIGKTIVLLAVGAILISKGQMDIGGLLVVVQLAQMIAAPAEVLAYVIHAKNESLPLLEKYNEIIAEIDRLNQELESLNPYAHLKGLSNKAFGEGWSEPWILSKCPNLSKDNGAGHDIWSDKLGRIEVKSVRLPVKAWTLNQVHPYDCDYFLFVFYDTIEGTEEIYLVPAGDIKAKFSYSAQHERGAKGDAKCISVTGTKKNKALLDAEYKIESWEALNNLS